MRIYISRVGVKWKNSRVLNNVFWAACRGAKSMKPSKKNKSWMPMNTGRHKKIKITSVDGMIWFLELNAFSESHSIVSLVENVLLPKVEDCCFLSSVLFIICSCHLFLSVDSFFFCSAFYSHFIWFIFFRFSPSFITFSHLQKFFLLAFFFSIYSLL